MTEGDAGKAEGSTPPEETAPEAESDSEVEAGVSESMAAHEPLPEDDVDGDLGEIEDDDAYEAALTTAATKDADAFGEPSLLESLLGKVCMIRVSFNRVHATIGSTR